MSFNVFCLIKALVVHLGNVLGSITNWCIMYSNVFNGSATSGVCVGTDTSSDCESDIRGDSCLVLHLYESIDRRDILQRLELCFTIYKLVVGYELN